jgi:Tol biopolymer transport system component/DNA-binding winged helix-turn-helix (wHTH) protein
LEQIGESGSFRVGDWTVEPRLNTLADGTHTIHLEPRVMKVLLHLADHANEVIPKDRLIRAVWTDVYVTDDVLPQAIAELRRGLGDEVRSPRYIQTIRKGGYRLIAPVQREPIPGAGGAERAPAADTPAPTPADRRVPPGWLAAAGAVLLLAALAAFAWRATDRTSPRPAAPQRLLTRLTFDPGLQMEPAWSPDGSMIAYSSDRAGNFDIWVQSTSGGNPVQVTRDPAHDRQPDWSPDGGHIVFRSERGGGGLYVVPALGGDERLLSTFGHRPRWSPDGERILLAGTGLTGLAERPSLYLVDREGGPPRAVLGAFVSRFLNRPAVAWHPDGQRISFWGVRRDGLEFWTATIAGGDPVRSEPDVDVARALGALGLSNHDRHDFAWGPDGRRLIFAASSRDVRNLWRVDVDPATLRWIRGPERLTVGPGADTQLALSRDGRRVAFATSTMNSRIWLFGFDPVSGRLHGGSRALTPAERHSFAPDLTRDGSRLLLQSTQPGGPDEQHLLQLPLPTGTERTLAQDEAGRAEERFAPRWSPDGTRIAYRYRSAGEGPASCTVRVLQAAAGREQDVTSASRDNCYESAPNWAADGEHLLVTGRGYVPGRAAIVLLPLAAAPRAEEQARIVTSVDDHGLFQAGMSPDARWVVFVARPQANPRAATLYVTPAAGGPWTQVTEGVHWDDKPRWAPDGRTLYFVSARRGDFNLWGIRFDPTRGVPVGEVFPVTSFEGPRRMILPDLSTLQWALAPGHLVLPMREVSGGIWTLEDVDR